MGREILSELNTFDSFFETLILAALFISQSFIIFYHHARVHVQVQSNCRACRKETPRCLLRFSSPNVQLWSSLSRTNPRICECWVIFRVSHQRQASEWQRQPGSSPVLDSNMRRLKFHVCNTYRILSIKRRKKGKTVEYLS